MKKLFSLLAAATFVILSGCASAPRINTETPSADAGYAVVSLGSSEKIYVSSHRLYIRDAKTKAVADVTYFQENIFYKSERDFDSAESNGAALMVRLPPGDYELYNFSSFINGYPSTTTFTTKSGFVVPFRVEQGKVSYLGEYLAHQVFGRSLIGLRVPAFFYMVVSDKAVRDISVLERKGKVPLGLPLLKFMADGKVVKHELIRNAKFPFTDLPRN